MAKFRKLPVTIEAVRYDGTNLDEIEAFMGQRAQRARGEPFSDNPRAFHISTLEGGHTASLGDWILKGVVGEIYPCRDDIFRKTYQAVDAEGEAAMAKVVAAP